MKQLQQAVDNLFIQIEKEKKSILEGKEELRSEWMRLDEEKKKMKEIFDSERRIIEEEQSNLLKKVILEKESWEEEKKRMNRMTKNDDIISMNVGGQKMSCNRSTLCLFEDTL